MLSTNIHTVKTLAITHKEFSPAKGHSHEFHTVDVTGTTDEGERFSFSFFTDTVPAALIEALKLRPDVPVTVHDETKVVEAVIQ